MMDARQIREEAIDGSVVVVTLNYRLGAFGFLHAPELGASGNEALLDQLAALQWVRREIAQFGGDRANVSVFGQSAGGFDIAQLMALPAAARSFDKAVPMSGSLVPQVPREDAARATERFAERFGGVEKLRDVPAEEILELQLELTPARLVPLARHPLHLGHLRRREDEALLRRGTGRPRAE
ncbi:MAG: carboxylesterase family protein [Myxococcota bacterium]